VDWHVAKPNKRGYCTKGRSNLLVIHVFWKVVGYGGVARVVYAYSSFLPTTFVPEFASAIICFKVYALFIS
jgi:hypothetical protein